MKAVEYLIDCGAVLGTKVHVQLCRDVELRYVLCWSLLAALHASGLNGQSVKE